MARKQRRRQKAQMRRRRRAAARKAQQSRRQSAPGAGSGVRGLILRARDFPIQECLIGEQWEERGLAHIILSRRQPDGLIMFGVYLVDLLCLGLKNTFCNANMPRSKYEAELKGRFAAQEPLVPCPVPLAHEIIYGAIDYARTLGFSPQADFRLSRHIQEARDAFSEKAGVEFGRDGRPLYVAGPDDNVERIVRTLDRTVGRGNYATVVPFGPVDDDAADEW